MKKNSELVALTLMALLTMGAVTGCGNNDAATNTSGSASSAVTESSAADESAVEKDLDKVADYEKDAATNADDETEDVVSAYNADIIGEVTVSDGNTLTVDVYEPHTSDVNLLTATGSDLSATGASEMIELSNVVNIKKVMDGYLVASSADVIENGDVVAVVTNEDGTKDLIILEMGN